MSIYLHLPRRKTNYPVVPQFHDASGLAPAFRDYAFGFVPQATQIGDIGDGTPGPNNLDTIRDLDGERATFVQNIRFNYPTEYGIANGADEGESTANNSLRFDTEKLAALHGSDITCVVIAKYWDMNDAPWSRTFSHSACLYTTGSLWTGIGFTDTNVTWNCAYQDATQDWQFISNSRRSGSFDVCVGTFQNQTGRAWANGIGIDSDISSASPIDASGVIDLFRQNGGGNSHDRGILFIGYWGRAFSDSDAKALSIDPSRLFARQTARVYSFGSTWTAPQKLDISHVVKPTSVPSEKFRENAIIDYDNSLSQGLTFSADLPYDVLYAKTGQHINMDTNLGPKTYEFRNWTKYRRHYKGRLTMLNDSTNLAMMKWVENPGTILAGYDASAFIEFYFISENGGQWHNFMVRRIAFEDGVWQLSYDSTNNYFTYWYLNSGTKAVNFTTIGEPSWSAGDHIRILFTRNQSDMTWYYWNNGVLQKETKSTPAAIHLVGNTQQLSLGARDGSNAKMYGYYTLSNLWDRCLSEAEAKSYIENPYQIFKARKLTSYSFPSNKPATPTPHGWLQG